MEEVQAPKRKRLSVESWGEIALKVLSEASGPLRSAEFVRRASVLAERPHSEHLNSLKQVPGLHKALEKLIGEGAILKVNAGPSQKRFKFALTENGGAKPPVSSPSQPAEDSTSLSPEDAGGSSDPRAGILEMIAEGVGELLRQEQKRASDIRKLQEELNALTARVDASLVVGEDLREAKENLRILIDAAKTSDSLSSRG